MSDAPKIVILRRDCPALLVPSGTPIQLPKGTEVTITQALGDSFTVNIYGNLARIPGKEADALGLEPLTLQEFPLDMPISDRIMALLKTCYDPEIPVNIVDLGLIYDCQVIPGSKHQSQVLVKMTLTSAGCGMGPILIEEVKNKVSALPDVESVVVELVFDPPWDRSKMSAAAQLALGVL